MRTSAGRKYPLVMLLIAVALAAAYTPAPSVPTVRRAASSFRTVALPRSLVVASSSLPGGAETAQAPSWLDQLNKASNFASILCAIDCTIFPILLALLPLLNFSTGAASAWLHGAAHAVALWFVVPVGGAAVLTNWLQHRRWHVGAWGLSGLSLVLLANVHLPHSILGLGVPHWLEHFLHARHEAINILGCALLLSSQRYAHHLLESMGKCCDHDHPHSHD